jgi:protein-disulfide isomerase
MGLLKQLFDERRDHYSGSLSAPLELMQYGDFQCFHCAEVYQEIKTLQEAMGDRIRFVFRHYPLPNVHPMSLDAAVAVEAAARQEKFWDMHDILFENQKYLSRSTISGFARDIELDMQAFEDNREHKKLFQKVINDFEGGVKSGVDGTPTFFINGYRYTGFHDFDSLYKTCKYAMLFKARPAEKPERSRISIFQWQKYPTQSL